MFFPSSFSARSSTRKTVSSEINSGEESEHWATWNVECFKRVRKPTYERVEQVFFVVKSTQQKLSVWHLKVLTDQLQEHANQVPLNAVA